LIEGATGNRIDKAAGAIVLMSTKSYVHAESFEKDVGFRFCRDGISILVRGMIPGRRLSAAENIALSSRLDRYFDEILGHPARNAGAQDVPLTRSDFVQPDKGPLFKFVCDQTWEFLKKGSFQFGTAEYYRNTPNIDIQDRYEGLGHFHLVSGQDQLTVSLAAGYNCAIFCGTSQIGGPNDELMRQRFGRKRIRIDELEAFASRAAQRMGAHRTRVYDVVYRDVHSYVEESPVVERFKKLVGTGNLTPPILHDLNTDFFDTFYEFGLLPGLYAKPRKYEVESECRIIFETAADIRQKPIVIEDQVLRGLVTF
jgi:hypothetical protein